MLLPILQFMKKGSPSNSLKQKRWRGTGAKRTAKQPDPFHATKQHTTFPHLTLLVLEFSSR